MPTRPPLNEDDDFEATGPRRMVDDDNGDVNVTVIKNGANNAQTNSSDVGLAQVAVENKIVDQQIKKEEEHWVKAYWRPAMGWLYMLICFVDFVVFPVIAMFLPVIYKGVGITSQYVPWASLTLANGGLVHLAFGAILGVAAWTRGQEKIAKIN